MTIDAVAPGGPGPAPLIPDLIVLAGGSGTRLGGAAKPAIEIAGRTLLSRALDARILAARTVVVGPESCRPAAGTAADAVLWTLEDPPLGGPVAGVAAGLAALERAARPHPAAGASAWVLLLACDLPWAVDAARILLAAAETTSEPTSATATQAEPQVDPPDQAGPLDAFDGIHLVDADGRSQWLAGLYRRSALASAVRQAGAGARGARMLDLLAGLRLRGIRDDCNAGRDVDTWQDVAATTGILDSLRRAADTDAESTAD